MRELFDDVPDVFKEMVKSVADVALAQSDVAKAAYMMESFVKDYDHPRLQEFADFYFNMRMEQLKNENNINLG